MTVKDKTVFIALNIVAWLIFVGLSVEAGGWVVNFVFSLANPDVLPYLYQKLDLMRLLAHDQGAFAMVYGCILAVALLKVYLFYVVILLVSTFNMDSPFNTNVVKRIRTISYAALAIGIIIVVARKVSNWYGHYGYDTSQLDYLWSDGQAFVLMAAVIYMVATIIKRGVDIQTENDLTV